MKVALVLPSSRILGWHCRLIRRLRRQHTVQVFLAPGVALPVLLRLWLRLEQMLFTFPDDVREASVAELSAFPVSTLQPGDHDAVVDLANFALAAYKAPHVLRALRDGSPGETTLAGRLLRGGSPLLAIRDPGDGSLLAQSRPGIRARNSLSDALAAVFERECDLIPRALDALDGSRPVAQAEAEAGSPYSNRALLRFALGTLNRRMPAGTVVQDRWSVAIRAGGKAQTGAPLASGGFMAHSSPLGTFLADPCLFSHAGQSFLFAEQYCYATRTGTIVWARFDASGMPGPLTPVMEHQGHRSYPQVFEYDGAVYMTAETLSERCVSLYRATRFPDQWTLEGELLKDLAVADPTLLHHEGLWWLFGASAESTRNRNDELFAYFSAELAGPYRPHPLNPLISDVRCARPAGRFIEHAGRLFRPAQCCAPWYGAGLVWCEVTELSPTAYREEIFGRWTGPDFGPYRGVHTYSACEGMEAIDLLSPHAEPRARRLRMRRRPP